MASTAENLPNRKGPLLPKASSRVGPHGLDAGDLGPGLGVQGRGFGPGATYLKVS
jgi:hypothetical protein